MHPWFVDNFERVANGERYPLVGGPRERHFNGINFEPRKRLENAQTPTTTPALACGASVAPAFVAGDRVHTYPGDRAGRCVGRLLLQDTP